MTPRRILEYWTEASPAPRWLVTLLAVLVVADLLGALAAAR